MYVVNTFIEIIILKILNFEIRNAVNFRDSYILAANTTKFAQS